MKNPNGYGSITKLSGHRRNPYMVRITDGRRIDKKTGNIHLNRLILGYYPTRKAAVQALAEYNTNPYDLNIQKITLGEIYENWSEKKFESISKKTISSYTAAYKHMESLKGVPIRSLKKMHLQEVIDNCTSGYQTKRNIRTLFNQLFSYAMENDIVEKNYSEFLDVGKLETVINRTVFSRAEIDKLWGNIDKIELVDTVLILIYSGMRVGELLEMQCCNVNIEEKTMKIVRAKNKSSLRTVPIHDKVLPLVEKHLNYSTSVGCETLIANSCKNPFTYTNYQQKRWKKIMEELGMLHLPHDTRHTFASLADSFGLKKICIKRIMGHECQDITERVYTHIDITELLEQINLIE